MLIEITETDLRHLHNAVWLSLVKHGAAKEHTPLFDVYRRLNAFTADVLNGDAQPDARTGEYVLNEPVFILDELRQHTGPVLTQAEYLELLHGKPQLAAKP
jgi:hypothetical protein